MLKNKTSQFWINLFVAIFWPLITPYLHPHLATLPEVLGAILVVSFDICIGYLSFWIEVLEFLRQLII